MLNRDVYKLPIPLSSAHATPSTWKYIELSDVKMKSAL